jgi:hypothetical protein
MSAMRVKSYAALDIDAVSSVDEPVARDGITVPHQIISLARRNSVSMSNTTAQQGTGLSESAYIVGDDYDDTATMSTAELVDRLRRDIIDVQGDEMIANEAAFVVTARDSGTHDIIHVAVSGMPIPDMPSGFAADRIRKTISTIFGLASNYNRVEPARPDQARFMVVIEVIADDGTRISGFVGTMQT